MNLMINGKDDVEYKEIIKTCITKGMGGCIQYFVITIVYNLITYHSEELEIMNPTDDQLGPSQRRKRTYRRIIEQLSEIVQRGSRGAGNRG